MQIPFFSWLFLLPICTLFVSFGIIVVSGQCLHDQQDLLIELKNSLIFNNTFSRKLVRWNDSADCCSWEGVTCSDVGRVVGVNLDRESISGGLDNSSSLFRLHYLQNLSLADNNFRSLAIWRNWVICICQMLDLRGRFPLRFHASQGWLFWICLSLNVTYRF